MLYKKWDQLKVQYSTLHYSTDFFICLFLWPTVVVQMKEHIDSGALNIVPHAPDHDSLDSRLDKASIDSEMDNIAKLYSSFGTTSNSQPQKTEHHENSLV